MPTHLDRVSWLYRQIAASARLSVPLGWRTVDGEALRHQDGVLDVRGERKAGPRRVDNKEGVAEQPPEPPLGQIPARWRQTSRAAAHAVRAATAAVMHCGCRKPERRVRPTKAGPASPISSASDGWTTASGSTGAVLPPLTESRRIHTSQSIPPQTPPSGEARTVLAVFPLRGASLPPSPHERAVWHFARRKAMASASSRQILVGCGGLSVEHREHKAVGQSLVSAPRS